MDEAPGSWPSEEKGRRSGRTGGGRHTYRGLAERPERLQVCKGETYNLVVAIPDPQPGSADTEVVATLNAALRGERLQPVETVANTIFPSALVAPSSDRQAFYDRYRSILPVLRKQGKNHRGIYFERLIDYPLHSGSGVSVNQLETIISTIEQERRRSNPLRFVYEAQVFAPGKDNRPIGFPCMSSLSFQLDGDRLRLTATYRNQYYIARALGNFLGLARLQQFISKQTQLKQGPLTVHAFHAQIDPGVRPSTVTKLIQDCRHFESSTPTVGDAGQQAVSAELVG